MSWGKVKLGDFLRVRENRYKPNVKAIEGLRRVDKIDFSGQIYLSNSPSKTDMILVKHGDLLISGINVHKGAVAVYESDEDITATIHYSSYEFDKTKIDIEFLKLFLKSPEFLAALKEQVPGGIKTEIKPKHLLPLEVVIPDLIGQRVLVENFSKIESQQTDLDAKLTHQLDLVKQLRQSFLREAIQGKLVAQDLNDEPASELLKKIKAEKTILIKKNKLKKEKPLPAIKSEEIPFEIPENWAWCRLGEIITFGPANGFSPKGSGKEQGIKCLTLTATTSGFFKEQHFKYVDALIADDSYLWLEQGDMLLQRGNSLDFVGIAALYNGKPKEFIYPDLMIKIRASQFVNSNFLHWVLISPFSRVYFQTMASGAQKSMPKITQGVVTNTLIPLPSLAEQHRIVSKLEQLMQLCDALEQSIRQSKGQATMLLQTALKEALKEPAQTVKSRPLAIPESRKGFAKQVLGGKIVSMFKDDKNFTHIKFQKLQYLAEHVAQADLLLNYYQQSAGPYDPRFMHVVFNKLKENKWFEEINYKFKPLEKAQNIDKYYDGYFGPVKDKLEKLFGYFQNADEDQCEIVATIYAVWNNLLVNKEEVTEPKIIKSFFEWSDRKKRYEDGQIKAAMQWMKEKGLVPTGFGHMIKQSPKH